MVESHSTTPNEMDVMNGTDNDTRLLTLLADAHKADSAYRKIFLLKRDELEMDSKDENLFLGKDVLAAHVNLESIVLAMAEIPSAGIRGIAAKAARLCFSLDDARRISHCDERLVRSLADDLIRLIPEKGLVAALRELG